MTDIAHADPTGDPRPEPAAADELVERDQRVADDPPPSWGMDLGAGLDWGPLEAN